MCDLAPRLCNNVWFLRFVRFSAYLLGAWLVLQSVVMASEPGGVSPEGPDLDLIKWATTQGGLVAVTLVILWSYRRDFKSLHAEERERLQLVTTLAERAATIAERSANALSESTSAQRDAADAIRELTRALVSQHRP